MPVVWSKEITNAITYEEAKQHLRLDDDCEQSYIESLLPLVTILAQNATQRALVEQNIILSLDTFPNGPCIQVPAPPLVSVTTVKYYDKDNIQQTLSTDDYEVNIIPTPGEVCLAPSKSWPSTFNKCQAVEIDFVAGVPSVGSVCPMIKQGMLLLLAHYFLNRQEVVVGKGSIPASIQIHQGAKALFSQRKVGFEL